MARTPALLLVLALLVLGTVGLGATASGGTDPVRVVAPPTRPDATEPVGLRAVRVLERWQAARSRAYSEGDADALRRLHVAGSGAGRRDVAVLQAYADRGVTLDLTTRTAGVAVMDARPGRVVVRTRSAVHAVARLHGRERALPTSGWAWRRLELRRVGGQWLLSAATPERPGSPRGQP